MVILFMALDSVHILHPPSFFGLNIVGTAHGLKLSLIKPLSNKSWTWFFTSSFLRCQYVCFFVWQTCSWYQINMMANTSNGWQ
jgi:hypothetical protein